MQYFCSTYGNISFGRHIVTILELKDVRLRIGDRNILDGLSMDIWDGHVHAIVGPNGAGKSTLANTIMGIPGYRHYDGDIVFDGQSLKDMDVDERARLGITLAWQEPARFEGLLVRDFIRASARDKSGSSVRNAIEKAGLSAEYLSRAVDKTLSGGERKKVELASIIAMEPRLVLLDEPDSGIDVESLDRIFDAIDFFRKAGSTVIMITHSPTVLAHAEHAFLICCGKAVSKGPVDKMTPFFTNKCVPCNHINEPLPAEIGEMPHE